MSEVSGQTSFLCSRQCQLTILLLSCISFKQYGICISVFCLDVLLGISKFWLKRNVRREIHIASNSTNQQLSLDSIRLTNSNAKCIYPSCAKLLALNHKMVQQKFGLCHRKSLLANQQIECVLQNCFLKEEFINGHAYNDFPQQQLNISVSV